MKKHLLTSILLLHLPVQSILADSLIVDSLLQEYRRQGAGIPNPANGQQQWNTVFNNGERSCASCHTDNLANRGRHKRTGKEILPMSPSVNPKRLSDIKKVNKWFKRNCKWTLGRECTPQEKSDFLTYINQSSRIQEN